MADAMNVDNNGIFLGNGDGLNSATATSSSSSSSSSNPLACLALNILLRPCHDGAKNEIEQLSAENKTELWSDLTGVETDKFLADEPQEFVNTCLLMLQQYLKRGNGGDGNQNAKVKIPSKQKLAFDIASKLYPSYVYNPKFLLKFLRAERYDIEKSAQRIFLHFDIKMTLFGKW